MINKAMHHLMQYSHSQPCQRACATPASPAISLPVCMAMTAQLSALQIIEWHLKGEEDERPKTFDVQQRVYVAIAPSQFMAFTPDEISSGPL